SDRPWQVMAWRSASVSNAAPRRPPTPIQFSGAHSRKSNAVPSAACSADSSPRRRPRPALALGSGGGAGRMRVVAWVSRSGGAAALALAALAFHVGLLAGLVRLVLGLVDEAVAVGVDRGELVGLVGMRGVEFRL